MYSHISIDFKGDKPISISLFKAVQTAIVVLC